MPGGPRQAIGSIPGAVSEAIVKPVADQFGQAFEEGVSSILGTPVKTATQQNQQNQQKPLIQNPLQKADEERRRQNILRYFDTLKVNAQTYKQQQDAALQRVRQDEIEEKQKKRQLQFETQQKKNESVNVYRAQRRAEIKVKSG